MLGPYNTTYIGGVALIVSCGAILIPSVHHKHRSISLENIAAQDICTELHVREQESLSHAVATGKFK